VTRYDLLLTAIAVLVGTLAVARAVRLVTHDEWPPILWARLRWLTWVANGGRGGQDSTGHVEPYVNRRAAWADLFTCPFCFAPYAAAVDLTWALLAGIHHGPATGFWGQAWWVVNLWAAVSCAASMVVVRDEPAEDE